MESFNLRGKETLIFAWEFFSNNNFPQDFRGNIIEAFSELFGRMGLKYILHGINQAR